MRFAGVMMFAMAVSVGPASAMAPPWMICDNADGTRSEFMSWDEAEPGIVHFVIDESDDAARKLRVAITHCPTRQAVTWLEPSDQKLKENILDIVYTEKKVTLRQIANRINRLGVKTQFGKLEAGICACDKSTYYSSF